MRQGHQNRRGRNRNNGGARKGQNPVTRSYESNGPDMKIRGTPAHIAEKYITLSRDAQSNGDPVLAENYLQHAEHYNRIILAYRDAQAQQHQSEQPTGPNGSGQHRSSANQEQPTLDEAGQPAEGEAADGAAPSAPQPRRQTRARSEGRGRSPQRTRKPRQTQTDDDADAPRAAAREEQGGVPEHEQPEFLRRSIRRPRRDAQSKNVEAAAADDGAAE